MLSSPEMREEERVEEEERGREKRRTERRGGGRVIEQSTLQELEGDPTWKLLSFHPGFLARTFTKRWDCISAPGRPSTNYIARKKLD